MGMVSFSGFRTYNLWRFLHCTRKEVSNSEIQTSIPKAKLYDSYAGTGTVKICSSKCNFHCKEEIFYDSDASTINSFDPSPPEKEPRNSGNLLPIKTNITNIKPEVETDVHESSSMKEQMLSMSKHIMELAESNLHLQEKEKEVEQSKEKEINDLKNQLEKQKVENQELL